MLQISTYIYFTRCTELFRTYRTLSIHIFNKSRTDLHVNRSTSLLLMYPSYSPNVYPSKETIKLKYFINYGRKCTREFYVSLFLFLALTYLHLKFFKNKNTNIYITTAVMYIYIWLKIYLYGVTLYPTIYIANPFIV